MTEVRGTTATQSCMRAALRDGGFFYIKAHHVARDGDDIVFYGRAGAELHRLPMTEALGPVDLDYPFPVFPSAPSHGNALQRPSENSG